MSCKLVYPQDPECSGATAEYFNLTVCEKHARVLEELLVLLGETELTKEEINSLTPAGRLLLVNKLRRNE